MQYYKSTLLTTNNSKTIKSSKFKGSVSGLPYKSYILYMSPYKNNSRGKNVCSHASKGCAASCLSGSGFGGMYNNVVNGRRNKTEWFLSNPIEFMGVIRKEIERAIRLNNGVNEITIRLNGTSDIPYENIRVFEDNKNIFEIFPSVRFYDYTKNHGRFSNKLPKNYDLTFSRSESNNEMVMDLLSRGERVAIVFNRVPKKYKGFKVVNGDDNDLTFTKPRGVILGLIYKKITSKGVDNTLGVKSGFVIDMMGDKKDKYNKVMSRVKKKELVNN